MNSCKRRICGLTCGMHTSPGKCVLEAKRRGISTEHITMSSDGHGSWSNYAEDGTLLEIGVSGVDALYKELKYMVEELEMSLEEALPYMTSQVAEGLDLLPKKGLIKKAQMEIFFFLIKTYSWMLLWLMESFL